MALVTWCDVTADQHRAAHSIPHFTFRIPHAAVLHFTRSLNLILEVINTNYSIICFTTIHESILFRIVNIWNSLPNFVVDVDTVCLFKTRLDKFWMHQDVMYDFAVDLTGIGDRSVREIS